MGYKGSGRERIRDHRRSGQHKKPGGGYGGYYRAHGCEPGARGGIEKTDGGFCRPVKKDIKWLSENTRVSARYAAVY